MFDGFRRPVRRTRLSRALPWLIAVLAVARVVVLLQAERQDLNAVSQLRDIDLSEGLRDRSMDVYELTQSPGGDWKPSLAAMERIRAALKTRYPEALASGDPAWTAFQASLVRDGRVDWQTASRMRDAAGALTAAVEQDATAHVVNEADRLRGGIWVVFGGALGIIGLMWVLQRAEQERERLASVLDTTSDYVCITDVSLRPVYLNHAFRRLLKIDDRADLSEVSLLHLLAPWASALLQTEGVPAALHDGSWLGEVAFLDAQGGEAPMSQRLHAHTAPNGLVRNFSAIFRDIGGQKEVERHLRAEQVRLAAIAAAQRAVAQADLDVDQVMLLIAEGAQALVQADGAAVETLEGDAMVYRVATGISAPHRGLHIPMTNPLLTACLERREVQYCADADTDPRANRAACQAIGCRSTLLAPVCDGPAVLGVLVLQSVRPDAFTEADAQSLQLMAEMVASTMRRAAELEAKQVLLLERTDAVTRLQESQELFRSSLEAMQEGFIVQDLNGNVLMCNTSAERILGIETGELVASNLVRPDWRAVYEDGSDFPREEQPSRVALRTGQAQHDVVIGLWREEAGITWLLMNAAPLYHLGEQLPYAAVITFTDVTEQKQIQQEIGRLAAIVESTGDAVFAMTLDGTLVSWNGGAESLYGYAAHEIIGQHASFLLPASHDTPISDVIRQAMYGEEPAPMEVARARKDGTVIDIALTFSPIRNDTGSVVGLGAIGRDITERKRTEQALRLSEARLTLAQKIAGIGNWELDVATRRMRWSQEMFQILEFDPQESEPSYEDMLLRYHPDDRALYDQSVQAAIENGISYEFDIRVLSEDERALGDETILEDETSFSDDAANANGAQTIRWVHVIGHCLCDEDARVVHLHGTLMEVTERKIAEERIQDYAIALEVQQQELVKVNAQLASLAATDALTNLSNRRAFQVRLDSEIDRAGRYHEPLSLVILDVDNFKLYNDAFGHPAGDDVLRQVACILQDTTRESDLVARYGGEEFVVIFPHTDQASVMVIAERCRAALEAAPWPKRSITASFGAATLMPSMSGDALVALADAALYRSKAGGRNQVTHGGGLGADLIAKAA